MAKKKPFTPVYAPHIRDHLRAIDRKSRGLIRDAIEQQLSYEPDSPATNRKPLRAPLLGAAWELRTGPHNRFRVFYEVDAEAREVHILAVGEKIRDRLFIAGEEVE